MPTCIVIIQEKKSIINLLETNKYDFLKESAINWNELASDILHVFGSEGHLSRFSIWIIFLQYRTILCVYIRLEWRNASVLLQTPPASLRGRRKWREPNKEMLLWRKPPFIKKKQKHVIYIIYMPFYASTKKKETCR